MSITLHLLLAIGALVVVLAIAVLGVWQFGSGLDQKGQYAARSPRLEAERMATLPLATLDRWLRRTTFGGYIHRRLQAAGLGMRLSLFFGMMIGTAVVAVFVAWHYLAPLFGVLAIGAVAWGFLQFLRHLEDRRREEFIGQLPELARVLSNSFSAGLALRTAVDIAAEELDDPAKTEMRRIADSLRLGKPTDEALEELAERLPSRELSVLVNTLVISGRAGGSMVTALRNISTTLEERKEIRREVKTVLAQATYSGYLIAILGVAELFLINQFVEGGLRKMTTTPAGIVILAISGAFYVLGLIIINRMGRVEI